MYGSILFITLIMKDTKAAIPVIINGTFVQRLCQQTCSAFGQLHFDTSSDVVRQDSQGCINGCYLISAIPPQHGKQIKMSLDLNFNEADAKMQLCHKIPFPLANVICCLSPLQFNLY